MVTGCMGIHGRPVAALAAVATRSDIREAAALLRRLLELVERGDLDAGSGQARAMVRRLEGAAVALESAGR